MNEDEVSLRHLKALSLLLELRSLTRVAEVLGTNQPTVKHDPLEAAAIFR
jgi:DNA-binding transcriptional LysR family regulator